MQICRYTQLTYGAYRRIPYKQHTCDAVVKQRTVFNFEKSR